MDIWPGERRSRIALLKGKEGKGKITYQDEPYPVNQPGAVTAANLYRKDSRLEWSFLNNENGSRRLVARSNVLILPPTIPSPMKASPITVSQQTKHTAQFLRLQYSDVEVASDLINRYITEEIQTETELRHYDPYVGNTLAIVYCDYSRSRQGAVYVAFPTGETRLQLNISPLSYKRGYGMDIQLSAHIVHKFKTPIEQIVTSNVGEAHDKRGSNPPFAVRTMDSVSVFSLEHFSRGGHATLLFKLLHSEVGHRRIVDLIFLSALPDQIVVIVVNDCGGVYRCSWQNSVASIHCIEEVSVSSPAFFRLAPCAVPGSCYLMSDKLLRTVGSQSASNGRVLLNLLSSPEIFTCFTGQQGAFLVICTTSRILWIDERHPGRTVLAVKHGRQPDRNLILRTLDFTHTALTVLASTRDQLMTVYDVSNERDGLLRINSPPHTLSHSEMSDFRTRAIAFFRHPAEKDRDIATLLRLSTRGSLHRMDVSLSHEASDVDAEVALTVAELSLEVRKLADLGRTRSGHGLLDRRHCEEIDLSRAYDEIFCKSDVAEQDPDAVHDLLDIMPVFWHHQEVPIDHTLTTFDIAFASGDEPTTASRADFFKDSILSSVRGYRALVQGRIPSDQLVRQAPWSSDITPVISRFIPDMSTDPVALTSGLSKYDLTSEEDRPGPSYRMEAEAREQLALDLTLSSTVYSTGFSDITGQTDDVDLLEAVSRATKFMSLENAEPPSVRFGFLRPSKAKRNDHYKTTPDSPTDDSSTLCPPGVRLLLDDWKVGSDPHKYSYEDPYGAGDVPVVKPVERPRSLANVTSETTVEPSRPLLAAGPPMVAASQPTRPPAILTSSQPHEPRREMTGSQPNLMDCEVNMGSQTPYSSTQILPGPHGGRPPPMIKKKLGKKRVGGF